MNKWLKKLKKKAILPAAAFLVAAAAIGTTFAWKQWDLSITNNLRAHDVVVKVDEEFDGQETKKVKFYNDGDASVFLRVSYSDYWISNENITKSESEDERFLGPSWGDGTLADSTNILSNVTKDGEVAKKTWTSLWPDCEGIETEDWIRAKDGWYYYKKILKAGESTALVLEKVEFPNLPAGYEQANYRLFFKTEVVQCSDGSNTLNHEEVNKNATLSVFGKEARVSADEQTGEARVKWYNADGTETVHKPRDKEVGDNETNK